MSFPTRASRKSVKQECPAGVARKSVQLEGLARASRNGVKQECPFRECLARVSSKSVLARVSSKSVQQECPARVSDQSARSECPESGFFQEC